MTEVPLADFEYTLTRAELRKIKAEVWAEGYDAGNGDGSISCWDPVNPYE
jgi:hypothetical protein